MSKKIAITIGDPSGIGPEIIAKALMSGIDMLDYIPVVIGSPSVMQDGIRIAGVPLTVHIVNSVDDALLDSGLVNVLDAYKDFDIDHLKHGEVQKESGILAYKSIETAIKLALEKKVSAVVTAPINKESFFLAGSPYPGHTEMFAGLTGTKNYSMILIYDKLRVAHVTTHVSMRQAVDIIKKEKVLKTINVAHNACVQLGVPNPVIAVAGLNPHAGENGLFGREEIEEIIPAIELAKARGINATGPLPADTLFSKAIGGMYDCIVAMYHDQGHIPIKLLGFAVNAKNGIWSDIKGVNVTFGLPVIRVSVDHGTAFGKAGKGTANPSSMIDALNVALQLC
ncbi:4-hydroxythreonine-4-phosphate dehydrogenase [Spirochaetia bacterium]|nr:4-hydroxythreonine-4-phosphate dehydrogenase [Spirochaetia bacterium]